VGFAGEMVSVAYNNKIMFAEMGTKKAMWAQKDRCGHKRIDVGTKNKFVELIFENSKQFLIFHEQIPSIL